MNFRVAHIMIALPTLLSAFKAYWNFPSQPCQTNYSIDFLNYSIEANTNLSFYGDKVVIFYEFILGRYPYYKRYDENQPINGGIPQNCSLEEHLNITKENITERIPDENYSGLAILDLEEWRPLFDQNSWKEKKTTARLLSNAAPPMIMQMQSRRAVFCSARKIDLHCISDHLSSGEYFNKASVFQNQSIAFARANHPNVTNETALKIIAKEEFNEAARNFFVETIREARKLRKNAKWGFYGFPYCNYDAGKNGEYECKKSYQDWNDRMMFIFNESTALYPSIYLGFNATSNQRFRYVQAILREARRIARKFNPPLPIYAYTKIEYDPLKEIDYFYNDHDLCTTIRQPADLGIDGIIFWSSSRNITLRCPHIKTNMDHRIGINVTETVNLHDFCRKNKCSGNGKCILSTNTTCPVPVTNTDDYECECDYGFSGQNCTVATTSTATP